MKEINRAVWTRISSTFAIEARIPKYPRLYFMVARTHNQLVMQGRIREGKVQFAAIGTHRTKHLGPHNCCESSIELHLLQTDRFSRKPKNKRAAIFRDPETRRALRNGTSLRCCISLHNMAIGGCSLAHESG